MWRNLTPHAKRTMLRRKRHGETELRLIDDPKSRHLDFFFERKVRGITASSREGVLGSVCVCVF